MAQIKHYFKREDVYEEFNNRGVRYKDWVTRDVEHYTCSNCNTEVDKNSRFCNKCGEKFTGIKEQYKKIKCVICGTSEKVLAHEQVNCCENCNRLLYKSDRIEIAKAFYNLGKKQHN